MQIQEPPHHIVSHVATYLCILLIFSPRGIIDAGENSLETSDLIFPRAIGFVVGQVGWMEGSSLGDEGGSWRAGIRRNFDVRDYKPFVEIGEEMGVRFMSLFILGELDRLNAPARYPTSTPQGANFDNAHYVGPEQLKIMDYVKRNAAHIEFGITGVMHEYWEDGIRTRAEWYDAENKKPREESIVRGNIDLIKEIMAQYSITPENGHSFPESFIAYAFYWNPDGPYSLGKVLSENGVKYANTHFTTIGHLNPPPLKGGGFDHGVLVLDRVNHGNPWYAYASLPNATPDALETVVVETHWANWLAQDDFLQPELNNRWIQYMKDIQSHPETYLAKNTEQLYSQWLYNEHTSVTKIESGLYTIDNRAMPDQAYAHNMLGNMVLAVQLEKGEHVTHASLNGDPVAAYFNDEGYGFMYLPPLEKDLYQFEYRVGEEKLNRVVHNTGTYNVYALKDIDSTIQIDLKMYGEQTVGISSPKPRSVTSKNDHLPVKSFSYDEENSMTMITLCGRDLQGERGTVVLKY
jgi:hypothetical protein